MSMAGVTESHVEEGIRPGNLRAAQGKILLVDTRFALAGLGQIPTAADKAARF